MMVLALQQTAISTKMAAMMKTTPEAIAIYFPLLLFVPQLLDGLISNHTKQDCKEPDDDGDKYIHKPSKMNSAVMLLEPMKAVTFHEGRAQVVMVPRKPKIAKVKPRRCLQSALMVKFCKSLQGGKCLLESCRNLYLTKLLLSNLEGKWKVHPSHTSHIF